MFVKFLRIHLKYKILSSRVKYVYFPKFFRKGCIFPENLKKDFK